jgi:hypothetical protein
LEREKANGWFLAHLSPEGRWVLRGDVVQNAEFVLLAKVCLARLGRRVEDDDEALQDWAALICGGVPGMQSYLEPHEKTRVCRGINHLAGTLCFRYQVEHETVQLIQAREAQQPEYPERAKWFRNFLETRGYTIYRFASLSGMDHRTLKKVAHGERVQEAVLGKLQRAAGCSAKEIPEN